MRSQAHIRSRHVAAAHSRSTSITCRDSIAWALGPMWYLWFRRAIMQTGPQGRIGPLKHRTSSPLASFFKKAIGTLAVHLRCATRDESHHRFVGGPARAPGCNYLIKQQLTKMASFCKDCSWAQSQGRYATQKHPNSGHCGNVPSVPGFTRFTTKRSVCPRFNAGRLLPGPGRRRLGGLRPIAKRTGGSFRRSACT